MLTITTKQLHESQILAKDGYINFDNGCSLILKRINGNITGLTPHGKIWVCKDTAISVSTIYEWLSYWDKALSGNAPPTLH